MNLPDKFIKSTVHYNTLEENVPAPYLRRSFHGSEGIKAELLITACGFYEIWFNGKKITKGALAPYISNPDDILYYDRYEVTLAEGENVVGILLGNGFINSPGGHVWDFDKAAFRAAPQMALSLTYTDNEGNPVIIESDESFRTAPSPIVFDDYRLGEYYDARLEIPGWNEIGFDDSEWDYAIPAQKLRGEKRLCDAEPILPMYSLKPVSVTKEEDGWVYDFGKNVAGVCRLSIEGEAGQEITFQHGEHLVDGKFNMDNFWLGSDYWERDKKIIQLDKYTCKGGKESYTPTFVYHGFQYVKVWGLKDEQATAELLTCIVMNSALRECGNFSCSDETINKLQEATRNSDLSNFYYFPTDCPQREKNGWTADAALSAEHMLFGLRCERSLKEWMRNICKAQNDLGALPGIVPTSGWGFTWGNGPAWDSVLAFVPYFVYKYRGDKEIIRECAPSFMRYLHYLTTRLDKDGLLEFGLGDWCPVSRNSDQYQSPLKLTDSIMAMDIAGKMAFMFREIGMAHQAEFAASIESDLRNAIRAQLIDFDTMVVSGNCQTSQAMALFYRIFNDNERQSAFEVLLKLIEKNNKHFDVGVLGARVIFHVLSDFGRSDLAFDMIRGPEYPSYGHWLEKGATTLWEVFWENDRVASKNHHFWGDISSWFMCHLAGIRYNPWGNDLPAVDIMPAFVPQLDWAEGYYDSELGRIKSSWSRRGEEIRLELTIPCGMKGWIQPESGYMFEDGFFRKPVASGVYYFKKV